jgi:HSP20 family molecular chaperone IbpA
LGISSSLRQSAIGDVRKIHLQFTPNGTLTRRFVLPEFAHIAKMEAFLSDGVLALTIPTKEEKIQVTVK